MNRNNLVIFGLIAFFVVGVGLTALLLLSPKGNTPAPNAGPTPTPPPVRHWVAVRDIPPRTIITSQMLTESSEGPAPAGAITDEKMVIGKISSAPIRKGEVVTASMTTSELARVVPASMRIPSQEVRAVAIWVDPVQTAAGLVDKGDRIDVIAAHRLKLKGPDGDSEVVSGRTIGQDLEVLAVDRSITAAPQPTPAGAGGPGGDPVTAGPGAVAPPPQPTPMPQPGQKVNARVIVAAPPEIAERLVAANLQGELHITIRDPLARDNVPIAEVREYPVRGVDPLGQKLREAAVQDAIESRRARRALAMDVQRQQAMNKINKVNTPLIPPADLNNVNTVVPTAPPTNEITVVRGTEKTRVVVPR